MKIRRKFTTVAGAAVVTGFVIAQSTSGFSPVYAAAHAKKQDKSYTIGVVNGYFGNGWREQMLDDIRQQFKQFQREGFKGTLKIVNTGADVNAQIAQIRNMINSHVDLLMIDPNSPTALNPVISEAHSKGIPVISFDQPVTSKYAINVAIDQQQWGADLAKWLVGQLHGKGDIVMIHGVPGNPADVDRVKGQQQVLAHNPNIKVLASTAANWDEAQAQQAMSNFLASYPHIDGVLTQDGMAYGAVKAFLAAKKPLPPITGEAFAAYIRLWAQLKKSQHFVSYAQNNPPGIGASALVIGINLLQGHQFKPGVLKDGHTYNYPVKTHITNANVDRYVKSVKGKPDTYFLDEWLTEKEAAKLFK